MRVITIDCTDVKSEPEFWQAYLSASEPDGARYFGRNLNAFRDALHGGPGWPGDCALKFKNAIALAPLSEGAFLDALRRIADESAAVQVELA